MNFNKLDDIKGMVNLAKLTELIHRAEAAEEKEKETQK